MPPPQDNHYLITAVGVFWIRPHPSEPGSWRLGIDLRHGKWRVLKEFESPESAAWAVADHNTGYATGTISRAVPWTAGTGAVADGTAARGGRAAVHVATLTPRLGSPLRCSPASHSSDCSPSSIPRTPPSPPTSTARAAAAPPPTPRIRRNTIKGAFRMEAESWSCHRHR